MTSDSAGLLSRGLRLRQLSISVPLWSDHFDTRQLWHIIFRYGWYISFRYAWHISLRCGWHIDSDAIILLALFSFVVITKIRRIRLVLHQSFQIEQDICRGRHPASMNVFALPDNYQQQEMSTLKNKMLFSFLL